MHRRRLKRKERSDIWLLDAGCIKLYDKEMLQRAAQDSGICEELFESHDEKPSNSFLYSLVMDTYSMGYSGSTYNDMPINHKIFLAQFDAIKRANKDHVLFFADVVQIMHWKVIRIC